MDLHITKSLESCVSKMLFPEFQTSRIQQLSAGLSSWLSVKRQAFEEAQSQTTRPLLFSKESGPSLFPPQQKAFLFTDSLLSKTFVSDYNVPDTTEQIHFWPGGESRP